MKMSVTRALAQIKQLDDRISRASQTVRFVGVTVGEGTNQVVKDFNGSVDHAKKLIQGDFDKIQQLMKNRATLKAAVVMSDATTKVTVSGGEITVAEAIELRRTAVSKKDLLHSMKRQLDSVTKDINMSNDQLEQSIQDSLNTVYGNEKGKVDESMYDAIAKPRLDRHKAKLLDPCNIREQIQKLEDEVSDVDMNLDFLLSESNARTEIEVDI